MLKIMIPLLILVSKHLVLLGNNMGVSTHEEKMDACLDVNGLFSRFYWMKVHY